MAEKINLAQFGKRIKTNFPQYQDMDDFDLGKRVLEKYPDYKDLVYDPRVDTEVQKSITEGQKAEKFLTKSKGSQITEAFIKTLPKTAYEFLIETPLKFLKSTAEAAPTLEGKETPQFGGYVSQAKNALEKGAKPFGYEAFIKPSVETALSVLSFLGSVKTGQKALSSLRSRRALQQTTSSLSKTEKATAGARNLKGSKTFGVKEVPSKYSKEVAETVKPYVSRNIVQTENNIKQGIRTISEKEILPQLESSSYKLSQGVKTKLLNEIDNIEPLDITKADLTKNTAFNLFKERTKNAIANANNDKELFEIRQILNDVANTQSGGKMWDDAGRLNPIQEFWKQAYRSVGEILKNRNPQLGPQLDKQSKLFTALEGIAEKTGKLVGKPGKLQNLGRTIKKGIGYSAAAGLGGYITSKVLRNK